MQQFTRRQALQSAACGFGSLAVAGLAAQQAAASEVAAQLPHFAPKAKRVIFLFMAGGPSQMDTFDYKPKLQRDHGKPMPGGVPELQKKIGRRLKGLQASPFKWKQHGQCGQWVSDLLPHTARHVDDLCFIKSLHTDGFDHGTAMLRLHTGEDRLIRPSMGAWVNYGLGTENENLPGFVALGPLDRAAGTRGFGNAFLPAVYQGTAIGRQNIPFSKATIRHLENTSVAPEVQRLHLQRLAERNRQHLAAAGEDARLEGMIESFEMAFKMQREVPRLLDISSESPHTLQAYGIDQQPTDDFGRKCLLARRLAESGVRFIQVTHAYRDSKVTLWDQHGYLVEGLKANCARVDQPIAALLTDLKQRGLLEDTLVWWGGEFGRTPVNEGRGGGKIGRDHNPLAFTHWLAGGGVKGGFSYGATDDYGYYATVDRVHMHDLHATVLHLLGLDHERLTYRYAGRDFRLTDVYGRVVKEIMS